MALVGNTIERNADRSRFVAAFPAGATLTFYNGTTPAATAAATGTAIAVITLPASPWDVTTDGQAAKTGTWTTTTTQPGTPTYFRLVNSTSTRQGVVGTDITAAAVANAGDGYTVTSWTLTFA